MNAITSTEADQFAVSRRTFDDVMVPTHALLRQALQAYLARS